MTLDIDAIEARARAATEGPWGNAGYPLRGRDGPEVCGPGDELLLTMECRPSDDVDATFIAHARQDIPALIAEVRRLRDELAASLPARVTLPNGTVAEIIAVQARYTLPTGGSWHESMSVATWRRQGNVREELRDLGGGGDREG